MSGSSATGGYVPPPAHWTRYAGLIALPLVALMLAWSAKVQVDAHASEQWVATSAVIVTPGVRSQCTAKCFFSLDATYRYRINNTEHTGTRIVFGRATTRERWLMEMQSKPAGSAVTVYVDPGNPAESVMARGEVGAGTWSGTLVAMFFCFCLFAFANIMRGLAISAEMRAEQAAKQSKLL